MSMKTLIRAACLSLCATVVPAYSAELSCSVTSVQGFFITHGGNRIRTNAQLDFPDMDSCVAIGRIETSNMDDVVSFDCVDIKNRVVKRVKNGKVGDLKAK
jgi:hypothetical protein